MGGVEKLENSPAKTRNDPTTLIHLPVEDYECFSDVYIIFCLAASDVLMLFVTIYFVLAIAHLV